MNKLDLSNEILRFLNQRPGMDPRNYCSPRDNGEGWRAYRREAAEVARDKRDAHALLNWAFMACEDQKLLEAFSIQGDRLSLVNGRLEYYAGQYYPTEYRKAVCRKLASLFWHSVPFESGQHKKNVQKKARAYFGRGIASRWFN